jgi:starch-binding outer membrane protein, SusD/RagB family
MKAFKYKSLLLIALIIYLTGCKKFIEVQPPSTSINEGNVYEAEGTAISAVMGIYTAMSRDNNFVGVLSFYPELSADNLHMLNVTNTQQVGYYQNNLTPGDNASVPNPWIMLYPKIFACNAAIEGLNESTTISSTIKQNLLGQVYFLRAFCYFYLTNFYGDVPLALSTNYRVNNGLRRSDTNQIYSQIITDLKQAQALLPDGYLSSDMRNVFSNGSEQRVIPNRSAASALLARVYLYKKDYANAEIWSSEVIDKSTLYSASILLEQVFLKNSKETIWALQPVIKNGNSGEADLFTLKTGDPSSSSPRSAYFTAPFMDNIQTGDQRAIKWISYIETANIIYPYPAKYKALFNTDFTEQSILLRIAEQYLIRAEARIYQNKVADGIADLNIIRERAIDKSEPDANMQLKLWSGSLSKEEAIVAFNYEKRIEFFAECAHRWLDLKRMAQVDVVMPLATEQKGGLWKSYKQWYPIPSEELTNNLNLIQNEGYN